MAQESGEQTIPIGNFNMGGLADSKWSGVANSLYKMIGFDPHSAPGILRTAQKMTKNSATTVTEFCKEKVVSTNGCTYWFSADSGKIWERAADGTWSLVLTTTAAAGEVKCLGAFEYQGYIYWATQSRLHRILASNAIGAANWAANKALNWATFGVTDLLFHPMIELNGVLYIGDGNQVAQVDAGVFTANALDIVTPLRIKALGKFSTDLLIGTWVSNNITKTEILRWNTWSVSWTNSDPINEVGINAFLEADNVVYVQAGLAGNIYQYDGERLDLYKRIPGDYSPTKQMVVNPSAVGNLGNEILFGVSNSTGNPCDQGVYRIGRNSVNYPYILDLPYPISARSGTDFVLTNVEIGAIAVVGSNVLVAWKQTIPGTPDTYAYGVDMLDYSNKLDGAYLESRVMILRSSRGVPIRDLFTNFSKLAVAYASLPASTDITIQYSKNYAAYANTTEKTDTTKNLIYSESEGIEATTLQMKVKVTALGNTAPEIESAFAFIR